MSRFLPGPLRRAELVDRSKELNVAAWQLLERFAARFDNGGSFVDLYRETEALLRRRDELAQELRRHGRREGAGG